ncbi:MAG: tetratricopeptide repeat protein [Candidatus Nitrohelix vancouverensis]|uniref:Tetratricopeptide repeat protein n=1 Tax=Candidatus Nitrohelix vancouverensis TaxID=2705534 RepID=A0A7T0G3H3_9BACT|nr:MAG: tetratricopeptide repeat protein [Candidatus Nitrohelix vancouverensis]
MSVKRLAAYLLVYLSFFLLLTPLGAFNDWIPPAQQSGYYSATQIDAGDDSGYYAWLRSAFFDGDLDFANELNYAHAGRFMDTGYVFNNWQMGQALFFLPFFLLGHGVAFLYQWMGYPVALDGYSAPYYLATAIASGSCLFAGLITLHRLLIEFCSERAAFIAGASLWLASPLIYFSFIRQRMAHSVEFFLSVLLLLLWVLYRKSDRWEARALLGYVLGLLCLTRLINIGFFALFFVDQIILYLENVSMSAAEKRKRFALQSGALLAGFFIALLPQLIAWNQMNGAPIPTRTALYAGKGLSQFSLQMLDDKFYGLFFSPQWGLIFSMPLAIFGFCGLFLKSDSLKPLRASLLAYLSALLFIIVAYPEDSASYGHRHLISALPVFAIGLGVALDRCFKKLRLAIPVALIVFGAVALQYLMVVQYKVTLPYNHPQFSWQAIADSASLILERSELLFRSTNWLTLMAMNPAWDARDILYLLLFPLGQIVAALAIAILALRVFKGLDSEFPRREVMVSAAAFSLALSLTVGLLAPTFSEERLKERNAYRDTMGQAESLFNQALYAKSEKEYEKAVALEPEILNPRFGQALSLQAQNRLQESIALYETALAQFPSHALSWLNLGLSHAAMGNMEQAEQSIRRSLRESPRLSRGYDLLGQIYFQSGQLDKSQKMYEYQLGLEPQNASVHARLAMVYTMRNQLEAGRAHLDRAVQLKAPESLTRPIQELLKRGP